MKVDNILETKIKSQEIPELNFPISSTDATITLLLSKYRFFALLVFVYLIGALIIFALSIGSGFEMQVFFVLMIVPILVVGNRFQKLRELVEQKFFQQFAHANNYPYMDKMLELPRTGALFYTSLLNPRALWLEHVISGEFKGEKIRLYCRCEQGPKNYVIKRTVFEIDYNVVLPTMLLKPDWNNSYAKPYFKKEYHLSLEGDFDHHFDLYVEKEFEIEALQIFTPDIMERLKTDWSRFVVEFSQDRVFIYTGGMITKRKDLEHMYSFAQYLIEKLGPVTERMESGVVAMRQRYNR